MTKRPSPQATLICLGEIVAAQGLKGWVRVKTFTEDPASLVAYGPLSAGPLGTSLGSTLVLKIIQVRAANLVTASIADCNDRTTAELLVGTKLYVECSQLPPSEENEFYHHDLIDKRVVDEQHQPVGIVRAVENYGAGDFLEITDDQGQVYTLPFNKDAVPMIDKETGVIHIDRSFLLH